MKNRPLGIRNSPQKYPKCKKLLVWDVLSCSWLSNLDTLVLQNISKIRYIKCLPPDAANPGLTSNDVPKREKKKEMDYKIRVYVVQFHFF